MKLKYSNRTKILTLLPLKILVFSISGYFMKASVAQATISYPSSSLSVSSDIYNNRIINKMFYNTNNNNNNNNNNNDASSRISRSNIDSISYTDDSSNDKSNKGESRGFYVVQSEAGPIRTDYQKDFRINPYLDENNKGSPFEEDVSLRANYVATTPRIVELPSRESSIENSNNDNEYDGENQENINSNPASFFETAKNMWDIFTALNSAWQKVGEYQAQQQSSQQEEERPRRFTNSREDQIFETNENNESDSVHQMKSSSTELAVVEGRYIKGDPLKGYYDFVITEGSYKFWAAFQLATAVLIIYSTFAAIYYSKVNPLVGDYDYIDYLGGGRSLPDDADFEDATLPSPYGNRETNSNNSPEGTTADNSSGTGSSIWSSLVKGDWLPRAGHAFEFVMEAIDKIPQND